MKQRNNKIVLFILLIVIALFVLIIGFGQWTIASIPFQNPEYVSESALYKQTIKIIIGIIMMIVGAITLIGSIIGIVVTKNKNE